MSTHIEWTDATWNPIRAHRQVTEFRADGTPPDEGDLIGWHCERVSPGCQNCYAETLNEKRFGTGLPYNRQSRDQVEVYLDLETLLKPLHWRRPRKIFVCSMTDLFGEWVPDEWIDRVFAVMALSPQHTFQVLTKRSGRMRKRFEKWQPLRSGDLGISKAVAELRGNHGPFPVMDWQFKNVWLGVSVEDQQRADERIPELLATPAAVRFISAEPLLGRLSLFEYLYRNLGARGDLHWVIAGGESGTGSRPMDIAWARSLRDQCQASGVAFFYKQGGSAHRCPHSAKGGCFECFPEDLRVREFPNA